MQTRYFVLCTLIFSQLMFGISILSAQQGELSIDRSLAQPGGTFQLAVKAKSLDTVGAGQLDLVFDPDHLEFTNAAAGELLSSALVESNLVASNRIRIAFAGSEPVSGDGVLVVVNFTPRGSAVKSLKFELENVSAWKSIDSTEIDFEVQGGTITSSETSSGDPKASEEPSTSTEVQKSSSDNELPSWVYFVGGAGLSLIVVLLVLVLRGRK